MSTLVSPVLRGELRDSAPVWAAVSLTFVTTTFALVLSAMVLESGIAAMDGTLGTEEAVYYASSGAINLVICVAVALAVISSSTGLVVAARRPAIARLALAGATPGQIVRLTVGQLVTVTLVAAVAGAALAIAVLPSALELLAEDRPAPVPPEAVVSPVTVVLVAAAAIVIATLGGLRQASVASRVSPLEAAREATTGSSSMSRRAQVGRWVVAGLLGALVVGALVALSGMVDALEEDAGQTVLQLAFALLVLTGVALSVAAPMIVGPVTAAWTRLVPGNDPAWHLASRTVVVRSVRLVRSVVPVMFAVGLVLGMVAVGATFNATFKASGLDIELSGVSTTTVLGMIGLALLISSAGAIGNLVMMSRAREAELAVSGLIGSTPGQRVAVTVLEAVILTVTGTALALVMVAVTLATIWIGLTPVLPEVAFEVPVAGALGVALVVGGAAVLATTVPVLRSLRLPEREVVATHAAD